MFAAKSLLLATPPPTATASPAFISGTTAEATSITTMPSHQSGDVLLMFAFRDGSNTLPTLPSGWTQIDSVGANTCSAQLAYKVAASSSETSGTWTSATELVCQVYRGQLSGTTPVWAVAHSTGSSATVNYPALTLFNADGTSVVAAFGGHRSINGSMGTAPTGMTQRANREGATADAAGFDTNGGVTSWSTQNVASGETASGYITFTVEILSPTAVLPVALKGANAAQSSSVTIPTHAVGDIIVIYAFVSNSNTTPSSPAASGTVPAWVDIDANTGANTVASHTAYFVATATNHTSGTWTGASDVIAVVLRGQGATPIGGHAESGGTNNTGLMPSPAITLSNTDGTSVLLYFYGSNFTQQSFAGWPAAPSGYTRETATGAAFGEGTCFNIKNTTTSDGSATQDCDASGNNPNFRSAVVEITAH